MSDLLTAHFSFQSAALSLRSQRQTLLASNIANADTPNYKARDMDFRGALQQAMNAAAPTAGILTSHPSHLQPAAATMQPDILYRIPHQDSIDGNTVELDAERAQFADNALRYEAELSELNSKIKNLNAVLQGS